MKVSKHFPLLVVFFVFFLPSYAQWPSWTRVDDSLGIQYGYATCDMAGGFSFVDFDMDGRDDISLGSCVSEPLHFYRNTGTAFQWANFPAFAADTTRARGLFWADFDNDGDRDVFVAVEFDPVKLYRNEGGGNFTDITQMSGLPTDTQHTRHAAWGDYDRDGWLDLYVGVRNGAWIQLSEDRLYHNNGNGTFSDVTFSSGIRDSIGLTFAAVFFDYNNDQWPDIYVATDKTFSPSRLYRNNGDGTFTETGDTATVSMAVDGMGIAVGDYDNDGDLDLYETNSVDQGGNFLFRNDGNGTWTEMASTLGLGVDRISWGANFADFDNDGDQDLYVANGGMGWTSIEPNSVFINQGNGTFLKDSLTLPAADSTFSYGSAIGDFDGNGFFDIGVMNEVPSAFSLYRNGGNTNRWLKILLQGTVSNREGIGSWIELWSGGQKQVRYTHTGTSYASQSSLAEIFGLGQGSADSIVVKWPSGYVNKVLNPGMNMQMVIVEDTANVVIVGKGAAPETVFMWEIGPVPASDVVRVQLNVSESVTLSLRGALGQTVIEQQVPEGATETLLDVGHLPRGTYFAVLRGKTHSHWKKLILVGDM